MNHWKETADIVSRLRVLIGASRHAALATVVRTEGSAYRRAGARLLVADTGETVGSVSSGCLEADVREVARGVMATGRPTLRHYDAGVDNDSIAGLGLGCNGAVDVFVQPATSPQFIRILGPLCHALAGDEPITIATVIDGAHAGSIVLGDADVSSDGPVFIETLVPPPHLLVCGAGDDSIPLLAYATDAGFRVTVYDRRIVDPALPPPERTLAVVKTHSFAHDREWVRLFLSTGVPYIGVMGPRDRTDRILRELGASRDRIFGPVGLDLGAEGAHQIAISIVAELLAFTRG